MKGRSKQGNRQPTREGRVRVSLRSGEGGEATNQIVNNEQGEGEGQGEGQLVKQEQQLQEEERQQDHQQLQVQEQNTGSQQRGEIVLVAEAGSRSSSSSNSSMRRSILPTTLSSSGGNTPPSDDGPVEHGMTSGGGSKAERVAMHPLAPPSAVDGDSMEPVENEHASGLDHDGGPGETTIKEPSPPTHQYQSIPSSTSSLQATPTSSQKGATCSYSYRLQL